VIVHGLDGANRDISWIDELARQQLGDERAPTGMVRR
jgi:hypothetical protein